MTHSPGKQVAKRLYLHLSGLRARVAAAEGLAGLTRSEGYNLVRLDLDGPAVAPLHYPDFFEAPFFPSLAASWLVDAGTVSYRTCSDPLNPAILHRKELLLPVDHPRRDEFPALTDACESVGFFDDPRGIG